MLKPPITISIVPSSLALWSHVGLATSIVLLLMVAAPFWYSIVAGVALAMTATFWLRRQRAWQLRHVFDGAGGPQWQWRQAAVSPWHTVSMQVDYLGPWLIGLKLNGRHCWLWPDSSDAAALWELRRELLSQGRG